MYVQSYQWKYQKGVIEIVLVSSLLNLNYFKSFPSFPIIGFEQVNIFWEIYLKFYSFGISFNVSPGERQDSTRSNARNSAVFLISHTQWDVTFARIPMVQIEYSNDSFGEQGKICINATTRIRGHKNKAGDCLESITSDLFPF